MNTMETNNPQDPAQENKELSKQAIPNGTVSPEILRRYDDFLTDRASKDQTLSEDQKKKLLDKIAPKIGSLWQNADIEAQVALYEKERKSLLISEDTAHHIKQETIAIDEKITNMTSIDIAQDLSKKWWFLGRVFYSCKTFKDFNKLKSDNYQKDALQ